MNAKQIASKLRALLGKNWRYEIDDKAPRADERAMHKARWSELHPLVIKANIAHAARLAELMRDPELVRLRDEREALRKERDSALYSSGHYRIKAGTVDMGLFFSIRAQGDTWAEVLAKLASNKVQP